MVTAVFSVLVCITEDVLKKNPVQKLVRCMSTAVILEDT